MNLYEITTNMMKVSEMLESEQVDEQTAIYTLEILQYELEHKGQNIIGFIRSLVSDNDAIDKEIERLNNFKKTRENKIENVKKYVKECMLLSGLEKVESPLGNISFRKSVTTEIVDPDKVPAKYKTIIPETYRIDKTSIKKAIESGEIVEGAKLEEHKHLQIK